MLKKIYNDRVLLFKLSVNDCKARFSSSLLGAVWTVLQPLVNMLVIWLIFQVGFKSSNLSDDIPFIVWYMPAFLVWNFFSEATSQGTNSLIEYSYLVKKVNFNVEIIPAIKVMSAALIHVFFIFFIMFVNFCYGIYPSVYCFQVVYYFLCAFMLSLGLSWLFGAITPFATDVANLVAIAIQVGFWVTPIFWDPGNMTEISAFLLKLNPMYYVCMGYRDTFIYGKMFWEHPALTAYFWGIVIVVMFFGIKVFNKSRPQFDDVL